MTKSSKNNTKALLAQLAASQNAPGLSSDEEAVFRFIQGLSTEKKEELATGYIKELSPEQEEKIQRRILEEEMSPDVQLKGSSKTKPVSLLRATANKFFYYSVNKKTTAPHAA